MELSIKNMVCPRCITTVERLLNHQAIDYSKIVLGTVTLSNPLTDTQREKLAQSFEEVGFELLSTPEEQLTNQIKSLIVDHIHYQDKQVNQNWSDILVAALHKDYSTLSKTFSKATDLTIEHYIILQKIERAKALLQNKELTISEIAVVLGYSSTAHFSTQFKKIVGKTASQFKKQADGERHFLDEF